MQNKIIKIPLILVAALFLYILIANQSGCPELDQLTQPSNPYSSTPSTQNTPTEQMETTRPTINLTSPSQGSFYNAKTYVTVSASAWDASGIQKVVFEANGNPGVWSNSDSYTDYNEPYVWNFYTDGHGGSPQAPMSLRATAYDNYGNSRSTGWVYIYIGPNR